MPNNIVVDQNNSGTTDPIDSAISYYLPPVNVIQTWNTKRIIPNTLLSSYTPFCVVFLVDDLRSYGYGSDQADSIMLGGPRDKVMDLTADYFSNPSNYQTFQEFQTNNSNEDDESTITKYFSETIQNNVYEVSHIKGIKAKIKGYNNNLPVRLIPLTLKLSQLTSPDSKLPFEFVSLKTEQNFNDGKGVCGYMYADISFTTHDINQLFSQKSVYSKVFQQFNRFFVIFGWQGPDVTQMSFNSDTQFSTSDHTVINGDNVQITLLDGSPYNLHFPSPFVQQDGTLNFPLDDDGITYLFDLEDTDNGNRMATVFYGMIPQFDVAGPNKIDISMKLSNAGDGYQITTMMAVFGGGSSMATVRDQIVDAVNKMTPIAYYDLRNFFIQNTNTKLNDFDADTQQDIANTFRNSIAGASPGGLKNVILQSNVQIQNVPQNNNTSSSTSATSQSQTTNNNSAPTYNQSVKQFYQDHPDQNINGNHGLASEFENKVKNYLTSLSQKYSGTDTGNVAQKLLNRLPQLSNFGFGFRTLQKQISLYNSLSKQGKLVANPYTSVSRHQLGLAIDLPLMDYGNYNSQSAVYNDFYNNANQFGLTFPFRGKDSFHLEETIPYNQLLQQDGSTWANTGIINNGTPEGSDPTATDPTDKNFVNDILGSNIADNPIITPPTIPLSPTAGDDQSSFLMKCPAAYRLGDVVSVCMQAIDLIYQDRVNQTSTGAVKDTLKKEGITTLTINGQDTNVDSLTYDDIFGKGKADFEQALKNAKGIISGGSDLYTNIINKIEQLVPMNETIGYQIIAQNSSDPKVIQFKNLLGYFKIQSAGSKISDIENKYNRFAPADFSVNQKIFSWNTDYFNSFNDTGSFIPISVADLPISIDTVSRIFRSLLYGRSASDVLQIILNSVSLDYGFSLQAIHRVHGIGSSDFMKTIHTEYDIPTRSTLKLTYSNSNHPQVTTIIEDNFFHINSIINVVNNNLLSDTKPDSSVNQIISQDSIFEPQSISDELNWDESQVNYVEQEYNSKKLNSVFILDSNSINSLVKSIGFGSIANNATLADVYIFGKMYEDFKSTSNGQIVPFVLPDQQDFLRNFTDVSERISNELVTKYHLMPGKSEYELKFLKLTSEVFEGLLNAQTQAPPGYSQDDWNKLLNSLNQAFPNQKIDDESRMKFLQGVVSEFLYNQPMGVRYSFYLGQINSSIHGTTGIGITNGLYVRGLLEELDGLYYITTLSHNIGKDGFNTQLSAGLIWSNIRNEANKILAKFSQPVNNGQ